MSKLDQRGAIQFVVLLILLAGIIGGIYLIQTGNLKLFSRASNPPIVFKSIDGKSLSLNKQGIPQTTSPNVRVELTSTLGPPITVSGPVSGSTKTGTASYRAGFDPDQLIRATFVPYTVEPTVYNIGFKNTPGIQFYWVEFKSANGNIDRRSAQIEVVLSTPTCKTGVNSFSVEGPCGNNSYTTAKYSCYDGFSGQLGGPNSTSCKPSDLWSQYAQQACQGHSSCQKSPSPTPTPIKASITCNDNKTPVLNVTGLVKVTDPNKTVFAQFIAPDKIAALYKYMLASAFKSGLVDVSTTQTGTVVDVRTPIANEQIIADGRVYTIKISQGTNYGDVTNNGGKNSIPLVQTTVSGKCLPKI